MQREDLIKMQIIYKGIEELKPYENNPRINEGAVEYVANSIKKFGFKVPCVIDSNNVVVTGHTRIKACKKLGIDKIPCIIADDLSEEQIKAFRLSDNKTSELSEWDFSKLEEELNLIEEIDMKQYGFEDWDNNFIDELFDEAYTDYDNKEEKEEFSITLVFPIQYKTQMDEYISEFGKEELTRKIIEEVIDNA